MDYCTYGHMIDNVVLIVTGTLHERDVHVRPTPFLPPVLHSWNAAPSLGRASAVGQCMAWQGSCSGAREAAPSPCALLAGLW